MPQLRNAACGLRDVRLSEGRGVVPKPLVVVVSGAPCTGKTTIALKIAAGLRLPVISKDRIKESLFDSLGWSDREWSKKLGLASVELQLEIIEAELQVGRSLLAENAFHREPTTARFLELASRYVFDVVQVHCSAEPAVLTERYRARALSSVRHPGHVEANSQEEFLATLSTDTWDPLSIGGKLLTVDTTDFEGVDFDAVLLEVHAAVQETVEG